MPFLIITSKIIHNNNLIVLKILFLELADCYETNKNKKEKL